MSNLSVENIAQHNAEPPRQSARNITLTEKGHAFQLESADQARTQSHKLFLSCLNHMEQIDLDNCEPEYLSDQYDEFRNAFNALKKKQKRYENLIHENFRQENYDTCFKPSLVAFQKANNKFVSILESFNIFPRDNDSEISFQPTITDFDYAHGYGRTSPSPSQCSDMSQSKRLDAAAKHAELLIKQKSAQLIQYEKAQLTQAQVQAAANQAQVQAAANQAQAAANQAQVLAQAAADQA